MDVSTSGQHHARVRVLPHIKKLDDCFGQFLVRVICDCGACREIEPEALARLVGWSMTLRELALRMRCSGCGNKAAEVVAVARPRPRGVPKNPHRRERCTIGGRCSSLPGRRRQVATQSVMELTLSSPDCSKPQQPNN
jgi:hypothetical protein